jgi:GTPase
LIPALEERPQIVAFNKMDLPDVQARWPEIKAELKRRGVEDPMAISAAARIELEPLLWRAVELLKTAPEPKAVEEMPVYRQAEDPGEFTIERVDDGWQVHGVAIERSAAMTYWEHEGSVRRFQRLMETWVLKKRCVKPAYKKAIRFTSAIMNWSGRTDPARILLCAWVFLGVHLILRI